MREWYTVKELSNKTNIPQNTIRRYIEKFEDFFTSKGGARSKRYEDTAINVLVRIKNLYEAGYESDQVDEKLRDEFPIVVDGNNVGDVEETTFTPVLATNEDITEIKKALDEQNKVNALLLEEVKRLREYVDNIDNKHEERDRKLMEFIRVMQEEKKAIAEASASREVEKEDNKKSWFKRLFGN